MMNNELSGSLGELVAAGEAALASSEVAAGAAPIKREHAEMTAGNSPVKETAKKQKVGDNPFL